jgi:NADPH:quinone reductase-like Zn-dependent oxidoreductase
VQTTERDDSIVAMTPTTMTAVVQHRYGPSGSEVLEIAEVPVPSPGPGEVLVEVRAAGVDRGVWHLMTGRPLVVRGGFGLRRPKQPTPGLDLAGVVVAVGPDVDDPAVGEEVFGVGTGAYADYAVAPAEKLATKPAELSFEEAAAVPISGMTALQAVHEQAEVRAGEHVLVLGASGGVGSYVVQVAHAAGAHVTGVASTGKLDLVRSLGADDVVDYTTTDVTAGDARFDVIIDIGGNTPLRRLRRILTPRGRLVIVGGENGGALLGGVDRQLRAVVLSPFVSQSLGFFVSKERREDIEALRDLIEEGAVTPAVDRTYPLEGAPAAVDDLAAGRIRGKAVVTVSAGAAPGDRT